MPASTKKTVRSAVEFMVLAIRSIAAHNTAVAQEKGVLGRDDKPVVYRWVHQKFAPLKRDGETQRRLSLTQLFAAGVSTGKVAVNKELKDAAVAACKLASDNAASRGRTFDVVPTSPMGLFLGAAQLGEMSDTLTSRFVRGGASFAVCDDIPARETRNAAKTATADDVEAQLA